MNVHDDVVVPNAEEMRLRMGELTPEQVRIAQAAYRLGYVSAPQGLEAAGLRQRVQQLEAALAAGTDASTLDEAVGQVADWIGKVAAHSGNSLAAVDACERIIRTVVAGTFSKNGNGGR